VDRWRAAYFDGCLFLATRRGEMGGPIYVFDTILKDWVSRDQIEPSNLDNDYITTGMPPPCWGWIRTEAYGRQRLLYQTAYHSLVYGLGDCDNTMGWDWSINQEIRTRAVTTLPLQDKRALGVAAQIRTLNPTLDIDLLGQGVGQREAILTAKEFDRQAYTAWGKAPYQLDNANDDYDSPHREDYLVSIDDALQLPATGELEVNRSQEWRLVYPVRALAESFQLELHNGQHPPTWFGTYPSAWHLPTGITLAAWRVEAAVAGRQMHSLT
jgi:hypothetical protein